MHFLGKSAQKYHWKCWEQFFFLRYFCALFPKKCAKITFEMLGTVLFPKVFLCTFS
jgi:hypothetical protein